MPPSCDKRWKFSAAHFQISDLTGALVRGILSCAEEKNESKSQGGGQGGGEGGGQGGGWVAKRYFEMKKKMNLVSPSIPTSHLADYQAYFQNVFLGIFSGIFQKCIFKGYFWKRRGRGYGERPYGGEERLLRPYFAFIATFAGTFTRYNNPAGFIAIF